MKFSELPLGFKVLTSFAIASTIVLFSILFYSVFNPPKPKITNYSIQTIDSCEYIVTGFDKSRTMTHKGNCKFCRAKYIATGSIK